jgi:2-acylglycerol O-acyltransferase 2
MDFTKARWKLPAAAAATMIVLRQLIMQHAVRAARPFGPRSIAVLLTKIVGWAATKAGVTFSTNVYESFHGASRQLDPDRQCIYVWHPHGAFTTCAACYTAKISAQSTTDDAPGPRNWMVGIASLLFRFPIVGEYLMLANARPVVPEVQKALLQQGFSYAIQPGGIPEQVLTDHRCELVVFPPNLGFVRMALAHGTPLVPIYVFGENQVFSTSEWGRRTTEKLHKSYGIAVPLVNPIPNKLTLYMMWGHAVDVGEAVHPEEQSESIVTHVFAQYVQSLVRLFNENKRQCLPADVAEQGFTLVWRGHTKEEFESVLSAVYGGELPSGLHVRTGVQSDHVTGQSRSKL